MKRALFVSSLLLMSGLVAAQDDGGSSTDVGATGGWCGFGSSSCTGPEQIMVGVWLCESENPSDCGCGDGGCSDPNTWFAQYVLDLNNDDNTCDSMGGWRPGDVGNRGEFPVKTRSFHYQVHPDDMDKANAHSGRGQYDVKVNLHTGDYCTGAPSDTTFEALDGNGDTPNWVLDQDYDIKSIRPYVDNYKPPVQDSIGIKFVGWPLGHMGWPYDEIDCANDRPDNVDGGCASAIDQVWCVSPEDDPDGSPNWGENSQLFVDQPTVDYAGNTDVPWGWKNSKGGIPLGSFMFGPYEGKDKWSCGTSFEDFCTGQDNGRDPSQYCLAARFWNSNGDADNWFSDGPGSALQGEVYINMLNLCKDWGTSGFCLNSYDDSQDPDEKNICYTLDDGHSSWLTDQNGNSYTEWPLYYDQIWVRILKDNTGNMCNNTSSK